MKKWYVSKTVWVGFIIAALGVLEYLQSSEWTDLKTTVIGALIIFLRAITASPIREPRSRDKKGRFTSVSIFLGVVATSFLLAMPFLLVLGCGTLNIKAKDTAHCKFKVSAPHKVTCTVDGKVVYTQQGAKALGIKGCCKCLPR